MLSERKKPQLIWDLQNIHCENLKRTQLEESKLSLNGNIQYFFIF